MNRNIFIAATVGVIAAGLSFGCPGTMAAGFEPNPKAVLDTVPEDNTVYFIIEEMPSYTGGEQALRSYIQDNMKYPEEAIEQGAEGTAYVQFILEKDGKVSNAEIKRGTGNDLLDAEAVRIVSSITGYKPGLNRHKPVRVMLMLPVQFSLKDAGNNNK